MNITEEYIEEVIGLYGMSQLRVTININNSIKKYLVPWVATITVGTNLMVAILCAMIYLKTKRKSHKPAFVFIGFLAILDVLLGG